MTWEAQKALQWQDEEVAATIQQATPVPESFDQAVSLAATAALEAATAGRMRQTMYFNTGDGGGEISGDIGNVLLFAEQLAKALAGAEALEGGPVRVIFTDMGATQMARRRWEPLTPGLELDYLPPSMRGQKATREQAEKFREICDAAFLICLVPTQAELPAILQLFETMKQIGADVPFVMINAKLVQNANVAAGSMLNSWREVESTMVPSFHLEQFDPPEDTRKDLSACVIARAWPRPYSLWEDYPEDPDAVSGFFLMDVDAEAAPKYEDIRSMLEASHDMRQRMMEV